MDSIFVLDDNDNKFSAGNGGKASFPEYQSEAPTKSVQIAWCDIWSEDLIGIGCSALLRGSLPIEIKKLADRALLPVPADAALALTVSSENARISHQNKINAMEREEKVREIENRVASKLRRALRPKAPLLLKGLLTKFGHVDMAGATIDDSFNGIAMFLAIVNDSKKVVDDVDQLTYQKAMEKLRDNKLGDNCTAQQFSDRVNLFTAKVNPFMEVPLAGERLSRFILDFLPEVLSSDKRSLKRELEDKHLLDNPEEATQHAYRLVKDAYVASKASSAPGLLAAELASIGLADSVTETEGPIVAAVIKSLGFNSASAARKALSAKGVVAVVDDKKSKYVQDKTDPSGATIKKGNRLPEGTWCSKNSCDFDHDRLKPGAPCFRDPDFAGPLPARTWGDAKQMLRINADRIANGKRMSKQVKELKPPSEKDVPAGLLDLVAGDSFMLALEDDTSWFDDDTQHEVFDVSCDESESLLSSGSGLLSPMLRDDGGTRDEVPATPMVVSSVRQKQYF